MTGDDVAWTARRLTRTPAPALPDYLPTVLQVRPMPITNTPFVADPPPPAPGRDLSLRLHQELRGAGRLREFTDLIALAVALARGARSVYVHGGSPALRRSVATVLATALEPATQVDWDDPSRPGVQAAPLRLPPAPRGWRASRET